MKRRRSGLYRRPDSCFWWCWYYDKAKQHQQSTKATNRRDAEIELNRILLRLQRGQKVKKRLRAFPTISNELFSALSEQERTRQRTPDRVKQYYTMVRRFLEFCDMYSIQSIEDIDAEVLSAYLRWLPKAFSSVSPVTANHYVNAIRGLLPFKVHVKLNPRNPGIGRELSQEIINAILKEADPMFRAFLTLIGETGLRTGHLCIVEREWIKSYNNRQYINFPPRIVKGRKAAPLLPLTDTAMSVIRSLRTTGKYLFNDGDKPLYHPKKVFRKWLRIRNKLGFVGRPYDLRHTFAIREILRTGNIAYVSQMLGHTSPATTLRYYQHLSTVRLSEIVARANPSGVKIKSRQKRTA